MARVGAPLRSRESSDSREEGGAASGAAASGAGASGAASRSAVMLPPHKRARHQKGAEKEEEGREAEQERVHVLREAADLWVGF